MTDNEAPPGGSWYQRQEHRLLNRLPSFITSLRFRILVGYALVTTMGLIAWDQIESAWQYLAALLTPIAALLGALLALKLGVVFMSLLTLLASFIKIFSGFLMVVIKPGVVKAIIVPPLMSLLKWLHGKSARLQRWVNQFYERLKSILKIIIDWWHAQNLIDKILLSGFLIPVLIVILVVFLIERATAVFAGRKLVEQIVQRTTKFIIRQFHRIPVIGSIPERLKTQAQKMTLQQDRKDLTQDLKNLGSEIYGKNKDTTDPTTKL